MKKGKILNSRVGEQNTNKQGIVMKIVEYNKSNDITILFLNGYGETKKTKYEHFLSGNVRSYTALLGQTRINASGYRCKAVRYIDRKLIEIEYENGMRKVIKRTIFNKGNFPNPYEKFDVSNMKPLQGFLGYFADKNGNIYNKKGMKLILSDRGGYLGVSLPYNGTIKQYSVHRLIAQTFIDNPYDLPIVNHLDGNKHNNSVTNLEWTTASGNQKHAVLFLGKNAKGEKNSQHILSEKDVREVLKLHKEGMEYKEISKKFNVAPTTIYCILKGYSWNSVTKFADHRRQVLKIG